MPEIVEITPDCFAIRMHGRRWLKTQSPSPEKLRAAGWRPVVWTPHFDEAEKFGSRMAAETFLRLYSASFRQNSQLTRIAITA